jgi:hypothetical protein
MPGAFAVAEGPLELQPKKGEKQEPPKGGHGPSRLPWSGELTEPTEKEVGVETHGISLTLVLPCATVEIRFGGILEPILENGSKNGLHPSHLVFSEKTGVLVSPMLPEREQRNVGFVVGELFVLGRNQQLITATG